MGLSSFPRVLKIRARLLAGGGRCLGGCVEGQVCADPGARTPISTSESFGSYQVMTDFIHIGIGFVN